MAGHNGRTDLVRLITDLAGSIGDAQRLLDQETERNLLLWLDFVRRGQVHPGLLLEAIQMAGSQTRIADVTTRVSLSLETRSAGEATASLSLFGQPVHQFYRSRHSRTFAAESEIEIQTVATTVVPKPEPPPNTTETERS